jgi:hypothetical protein
MSRESDWIVANLGQAIKRQQSQMKLRKKPETLLPQEQVRRFLAGEERWRVDAGLVTPVQFAEYEREMLKRLGMEV